VISFPAHAPARAGIRSARARLPQPAPAQGHPDLPEGPKAHAGGSGLHGWSVPAPCSQEEPGCLSQQNQSPDRAEVVPRLVGTHAACQPVRPQAFRGSPHALPDREPDLPGRSGRTGADETGAGATPLQDDRAGVGSPIGDGPAGQACGNQGRPAVKGGNDACRSLACQF